MIPAFLDMTPHFATFTTDAVDPVTSVMNALRIALLGAGWDEPGAMYTLRSPLGTGGIRFTITIAKITNTQASYIVKDHLGRLVNNVATTRQNLAANSTVCLYFGDMYCYVENFNGGNQTWGCGVLEKSPDPIDKPFPVYFASYGPVQNDGTTVSYVMPFYATWVAAGGAGSTLLEPPIWLWPGNGCDHFTAQGSMMFLPSELGTAGSWWWGRIPNVLLVDASQQVGATFDVPLDDVTTGTFRVIRGTTVCGFVAAVRIA